ncbi:MAG TPA: response regulator [Burkholderiales bacterium]|nr:response regulator [Burkholderiales bacterium]
MAAAERNINAAQSSSDPSASPNGLRVLIVDDERDTVTTLMELLADEGYQVRGVYKGRDALDAMREFAPDAVVMDLALPDISGWEVARRIRASFGDERPTLIAISGRYKQSSDKVLGRISGFNHQLDKPCEPRALIALLAKSGGTA